MFFRYSEFVETGVIPIIKLFEVVNPFVVDNSEAKRR